jgi:hydroxyacylglutathione hydrolase
MEVITMETPALGDRSYVVAAGTEAAVIDPQRDIDRIESLLTERGLRLRYVFETHVHNDYVTGGVELARRAGADYVLPADDDVAFDRIGAHDGDEFRLGELVVRARHTPGHTPHHLTYIVSREGRPAAAFTGGSMLFGAVGRTDLISSEATEGLTRAQYRSAHRLAEDLPDDTTVHPTHGFGSFCSAGATSGAEQSTVGLERRSNMALMADDEDAFVKEILGGLTAYPRYYAHMAAINRQGPAPVDLTTPEPVDAAEIRRRIHRGEWVVDLRDRAAFARGHLAGTVNLEVGDSFTTYLGWTLPWGTPVTLVGDTRGEVAEAQRQMARIGIDRPAGGADGGIDTWAAGGDVRSYRTATFDDLADARGNPDLVVLDVRRDDEWAEGAIDGALHIPLHDLQARLPEIPDGQVWVHCASGYRASLAASLLDRVGRAVIAIDDDWSAAAKQGRLQLVGSQSR